MRQSLLPLLLAPAQLLRAPPLPYPRHVGAAARPVLPRHAEPIMNAPIDEADVAKRVAHWCLRTPGRENAAVLVSSASSTAEMLRDFWSVSHDMGEASTPGTYAVAFPSWKAGTEPRYFQAVANHLLACGEVCEHVCDSIIVSARHPAAQPTEQEPVAAPCPVILLRSFERGADFDESTDPFGPDSIFADGDDPFAEPPPPPPPPDDVLLSETQKWVDSVIVHMKVCPFSSSVEKAGLPVGGVTYPICHSSTAEGVYKAFWSEICEMSHFNERERATVLLITPDFAMYAPGFFDAFADTLNAALGSLGLERGTQLVFFHPEYTFRDGKQRNGMNDDAAANYARRSPYPMVNLLRTPQVRAAQKGIPTGSVYDLNERNLHSVGAKELQKMLESRDWDSLKSMAFEKHNSDTWTL
ncbi:hypothetical protein AB1Y20_015276 [Prymnesium parvum]|uniref:Uncharacterized protein n=1 Tax=Prymnesium parvum TaxID=97485 RepID=A0AB34K085_PRYPA